MYCYRITKYNPKFRDTSGVYKKDEWISYSDISHTFEGEVLSAENYLNVEEAYIEAISLFINATNMDALSVAALEKYEAPKKTDYWYSQDLLDTYHAIGINQDLDSKTVLVAARLALRKYLWCKLESENMFVHFGHDYYMYIGSKKKPTHIIPQIESLGLFVEKIDESPYMQTASDNESDEN